MSTTKHYYTLGEFVEHIEALPDGGRKESDISWSGGNTLDECIRFAKDGWPEGTKLATESALKIANRIAEKTANALLYEVDYDVVGAAFDVGAVMLGIPEAWGYQKPHESKRAIRIVVNCWASGGVSAEALRKRGIAVAALALTLQSFGHPLTIDVTTGRIIASGNVADCVRVVDASSGSQLDVDRIVFALAHPGMWRHLWRSFVNGKRHCPDDSLWGAARGWTIHYAQNEFPTDEPIDISLGGTHLNEVERWKGDAAENWVLEQFHKQTD